MDYFSSHILSWVTFLPLAGVVAILLISRAQEERIRRIALATSLVEFLISLPLYTRFVAEHEGMQFEEFRPWISSPPINYHLGMDGLSLFLVLLVTFLTPLAVLCSWRGITHRVKEFFIFLLVLETGMIGVFVSLDLFLFYVFWEVMLIPMYFLIGVWGHERRIYAAVKFIIYTMAGSVLMLVAIIWLYLLTTAVVPGGTFDLPQILAMLRSGVLELPQATQTWLFLAFFLAFAIKVPLFPFHTWLPDAHVEAPTAGSVILAGVLLKMGTYGLLRFCLPLFPEASHRFAPMMAVLALIGIIYGALVSMVQPDVKKLIAFSSVSHLGFVVLGIAAMNQIAVQGAIYQMLNHGVSTGALFIIAGMLYERRHTHLIREFGGLATPVPWLAAFFMIVALSSIGLPMLNGFVGEFLILLGVFHANVTYAVLGATGVVLSAVYMLWMYQRVIFGGVTKEVNRSLPDLSRREKAILIPLVIMILWMGIGSSMFLSKMETSTRIILQQAQGPAYRLARGGGLAHHGGQAQK